MLKIIIFLVQSSAKSKRGAIRSTKKSFLRLQGKLWYKNLRALLDIIISMPSCQPSTMQPLKPNIRCSIFQMRLISREYQLIKKSKLALCLLLMQSVIEKQRQSNVGITDSLSIVSENLGISVFSRKNYTKERCPQKKLVIRGFQQVVSICSPYKFIEGIFMRDFTQYKGRKVSFLLWFYQISLTELRLPSWQLRIRIVCQWFSVEISGFSNFKGLFVKVA